MLSKESVLVIGLDGGTFDLLSPLVEAGVMPCTERLIEKGASGVLQSTIPPVTAPAWASFQTGTNPGKHGLVDFLRYQPGSYEPALADARAIRGQTLWRQLSQHGKRICAVNVPLTYPPQPVNGYMVSGFLTPNLDVPFTYPAGLRQQLLTHVPDYAIAPVLPKDAVTNGVGSFVQGLLNVVERRAEAAKWLMQQDSWDLFMVHFQATDILQHALWDCLDPTQSGFAGYSARERDQVQHFYHSLDRAIGNLAETAGESTIIIMSDHGFGPARKRVYLNRWLANHGYLALNASELLLRAQAGLEGLAKRLDVLDLRNRLLPKDFKGDRGHLIRKLAQDPWIDWGRTQAFVFSGSTFGHLYINLAGREPSGAVASSEYESLRSELIQCFETMTDPDTGQRVVERVYRREEAFSGPMLEAMPDLVVRPQGGYLLETRFSGARLFGPMPKGITGLHRMDGICILSGGSARSKAQLHEASIVDLTPTILYLLGVPVPDSVDGHVLDAIDRATTEPSCEQATSDEPAVTEEKPDDHGYSTEEESEILERLQGLGYL